MKLLVQQNEIGGKRKTAAAIKQLEQAQERISEISRIIKRLYEDNVNGKISDERFMELSADYEAEQAELKKRAACFLRFQQKTVTPSLSRSVSFHTIRDCHMKKRIGRF